MSATRNDASLAAKHEAFRSRVPPSKPLTTKGHKPGVLVGKDAIPEFRAKTLPPGTAPPEATFVPATARPSSSGTTAAYADADADADADTDEDVNPAWSTLPGATSKDLNRGYGKPLYGQEGRELRHNGLRKRKRIGAGLEGVGASGVGYDKVRAVGADLPEGVVKGTRGKHTDAYPTAEERVPESAETLATEFK